MKYLSNIDLNKNELQNARIQNLATAPASPVSGQVYYNTMENKFYGYNGAAWVDLGKVLDGTAIVTLINPSSSIIDDDNLSANVNDSIIKKHSHSNKSTLDSITAAYSITEQTKLNGISSGANKVEQSTNNGNIKIDGAEKTVYIHPGTGANPHGTTQNDIGIRSGADASKPVATGSGMIYFSTDIKKIWKDTAANTWTQMGGQDTLDWDNITGKPTAFVPQVASSTTLGGIKVGANLTIDADGVLCGNNNPQSYLIKRERFIATANQTNFTLTKGSYAINTNALAIFINGAKQFGDSIIENSSTSFQLKVGADDGQVIIAEYIQAINIIPYPVHSSEHLPGGKDVIPDATTASHGLMSDTDKAKLDGIAVNANNYNLPVATSTALGGMKAGGDILVDGNGNVSLGNSGVAAGSYTKVTVDSKGRITLGANLVAADIPIIDHNKVSDFDTAVRTSALNQMAVPTADLSLNGKKITNLADPISGKDAVTKDYADSLRAGLSIKDPVRAATTANITLSGTQTIDGVSLVVGDRILVKDQTTASQNGIYLVQTGAWVRASDADLSSEVVGGMASWVNEGSTNGDSRWVLTTNNPIAVGTTNLTFVKDFQASDIVAGTGLAKNGNMLSLADNGVVTGTYTKVTVDSKGRVMAGAALSSSDVTNALSYIPCKKYSANIGDGTSMAITVTHSLGNMDVIVNIREAASPYNAVITDIQIVDSNNIKLLFAVAPTSNQFRVTIIG